MKLPNDLYEVGRTYGSGRFFDGELQIANPFSPTYSAWIEFEMSIMREQDPGQFRSPDGEQYTLFPEDGGLYPFGRDYNGNRFYWRTLGKPDQWPIVCRSNSYEFEEVQCSLTEFLTRLVTNELDITYRRYWGNPKFTKQDRTFFQEPPLAATKKKATKKKATKKKATKKKATKKKATKKKATKKKATKKKATKKKATKKKATKKKATKKKATKKKATKKKAT